MIGAVTCTLPERPPPPVVGIKTVTLVPMFKRSVIALFRSLELVPVGVHVLEVLEV